MSDLLTRIDTALAPHRARSLDDDTDYAAVRDALVAEFATDAEPAMWIIERDDGHSLYLNGNEVEFLYADDEADARDRAGQLADEDIAASAVPLFRASTAPARATLIPADACHLSPERRGPVGEGGGR